ncbi:T cell receptor gamma chain [Roseibium sp. TrichSKD4]|uniref:hypothetical protein n=1 Tax=Roseibium sp. TrichSKD4 TaxID=744980 RepID=UPI0001E56C8F|nr:hypothetical protein [Roseibium sp. TrichSKD4]EFO31630.1 T cell receptor gamma chain [Roseibium sp. TrichSKD4]EFO33199.1 T cell receptor gamma chain [Roseibium sp. TrichSKD4]
MTKYVPEPEESEFDEFGARRTGLLDLHGRELLREPEPVGFVPSGFRPAKRKTED